MIYLVAKNKRQRGCYAYKTVSGKHISLIKRSLHKEVGAKGVQIVTISRPSAYGEYAPYSFVHSENEFVEKARTLAD